MEKGRVIIFIALMMGVSLAFAQTNAQVSFMITIDTSSPDYSDFNSSTKVIDSIGQSINFSAYWNDTFEGLDSYYFEWNVTGSFVNDTAQNFTNEWSNVTKSIDNVLYEGRSVYYSFHASDINNNWNSTYYDSFNIISQAPQYDSISMGNSTPIVGQPVMISSHWTDNFNVYEVTLQSNETTSWIDRDNKIINSTAGWANFTFDTTELTQGQRMYWRLIGSDSILKTNITEEYYFDVV